MCYTFAYRHETRGMLTIATLRLFATPLLRRVQSRAAVSGIPAFDPAVTRQIPPWLVMEPALFLWPSVKARCFGGRLAL